MGPCVDIPSCISHRIGALTNKLYEERMRFYSFALRVTHESGM